jgi:hypothetical protein
LQADLLPVHPASWDADAPPAPLQQPLDAARARNFVCKLPKYSYSLSTEIIYCWPEGPEMAFGPFGCSVTDRRQGMALASRAELVNRIGEARYLVNTSAVGIRRVVYSSVAIYFHLPEESDGTTRPGRSTN